MHKVLTGCIEYSLRYAVFVAENHRSIGSPSMPVGGFSFSRSAYRRPSRFHATSSGSSTSNNMLRSDGRTNGGGFLLLFDDPTERPLVHVQKRSALRCINPFAHLISPNRLLSNHSIIYTALDAFDAISFAPVEHYLVTHCRSILIYRHTCCAILHIEIGNYSISTATKAFKQMILNPRTRAGG